MEASHGTVGHVQWVLQGGPAHNAGLKSGDFITEWDGLPLSTVPIDDITEFVEETESQVVKVVLIRSDRLERLTIKRVT